MNKRGYVEKEVLRRFRIWESARLREEMTKLCGSIQNITNRDMKARILSIAKIKNNAKQRAFYRWVY